MDFRYQTEHNLRGYWGVDFNDAGGWYQDLICYYATNGGYREYNADEFNGKLRLLRYRLQPSDADDLTQQKLSQLFTTLNRINRKLHAIASKEGSTNSFSEYIRRICLAVGAKVVGIGEHLYPVAEALPKIDKLVREQRANCLKITENDLREIDVHEWCECQGYTEPRFSNGEWTAFPPGGLTAVPIDEFVFG